MFYNKNHDIPLKELGTNGLVAWTQNTINETQKMVSNHIQTQQASKLAPKGPPCLLERAQKRLTRLKMLAKELKTTRQPRFLANCQKLNNVAACGQNKMKERGAK